MIRFLLELGQSGSGVGIPLAIIVGVLTGILIARRLRRKRAAEIPISV
jgi:uncharacterized protein YneF (UPF0154 family)